MCQRPYSPAAYGVTVAGGDVQHNQQSERQCTARLVTAINFGQTIAANAGHTVPLGLSLTY
jgi:hypothetical protein